MTAQPLSLREEAELRLQVARTLEVPQAPGTFGVLVAARLLATLDEARRYGEAQAERADRLEDAADPVIHFESAVYVGAHGAVRLTTGLVALSHWRSVYAEMGRLREAEAQEVPVVRFDKPGAPR